MTEPNPALTGEPKKMPSESPVRQGVRDRVRAALAEKDGREYAPVLLGRLRENTIAAEGGMLRRLLLMFFLIGVFELLRRTAVTGVTLGPFAVNDMSYVYKLVPVVIAYCYFEFEHLVAMRNLYGSGNLAVLEAIHPSVVRHDIEELELPPSPFTAEGVVARSRRDLVAALIRTIAALKAIVSTLAPPAYIGYAYVVLFRKFGVSDSLVWIGFVGSAALLLEGVLVGVQALRYEGLYDEFLRRLGVKSLGRSSGGNQQRP